MTSTTCHHLLDRLSARHRHDCPRRAPERAQPTIDYLEVFERGANLFPGFEAEIQGVYREKQPDGSSWIYTYVIG
jgi:hypothetical protein